MKVDFMKNKIKLPRLGDTADEVVVIEWLVGIGTRVSEGDPILRVETSKVNSDVVSPVSGIVSEYLVQPGDDVAVGAAVLVVESD